MFKIIKRLFHIINHLVAHFLIIFFSLIAKTQIKINDGEFGENLRVNGRIHIKAQTGSKLIIGDNFKLNSRFVSNLVGLTNKAIFQLIGSARIVIGDNCGFSSPVFSSRSQIIIGNRVMIGGNVRIFDHDYHSLNHEFRKEQKQDALHVKTAGITIGDDVFIGTNSIILKGVNIGARSVIGAGSVVSLKQIPPDSLVAGNPAKIIKKLDD